MTYKTIILAAETDQEINSVTFELVDLARKLAPDNEAEIVYPTHLNHDCTEQLAETTGLTVSRLKIQGSGEYDPQTYKQAMQSYLDQKGFSFLLAANTTRNRDYIPALAHKFGSTCISQVSDVKQGEQDNCLLRPIFAGKYEAVLEPEKETAFLLIQPGSFQAEPPLSRNAGEVVEYTYTGKPESIRSLGMEKDLEESEDLKNAQVVVSAGRGISEQENLDLIKKTASMFPRGSMACSRPICDMGWLDYKYQVGETGNTVSPEVYMACGISGSMQHISGMSGSQLIVAINKDPGASIFNYSDICIQEEVVNFLQTFLDVYAENSQQGQTQDPS